MSGSRSEEVEKLLGVLSSFPGQAPATPIAQPQFPQPPLQQSYYPNAVSLASILQPQTLQQPQHQPQAIQQFFNYPNAASTFGTPSAPSTPLETPVAPPPKPVKIDPSTITNYPRALTYITKTLNTPSFVSKIQKMKKSQHSHERQWFAERQSLVTKHANRHESSAKLASLMSSLPGFKDQAQNIHSLTPSEEANKKELLEFDLKTHRKTMDLVRMMEGELAGLGVPFFCGGKGGKEKNEGGEMEPEELRKLRAKVLELLEDLAAEE